VLKMMFLDETELKMLEAIRTQMSALHERVMNRISHVDDCEASKFSQVSERIIYDLLNHFGAIETMEGILAWFSYLKMSRNDAIIERLLDFLHHTKIIA
jgi:hypothetical protein